MCLRDSQDLVSRALDAAGAACGAFLQARGTQASNACPETSPACSNAYGMTAGMRSKYMMRMTAAGVAVGRCTSLAEVKPVGQPGLLYKRA